MKKKRAVRTPKGKYRIVMMSCGYVESNCTSWLIYHVNGARAFKKKTDAVKALALDMYNKYVAEELSFGYLTKCCKDALAKYERFCSYCGRSLKEKQFDQEAFEQFIVRLHGTTCDDYGEAEEANGHEFTFWPWDANRLIGAKENEVVFIPENAEHVLTDALYDQKPELMSPELLVSRSLPRESWQVTDWDQMKKEEK